MINTAGVKAIIVDLDRTLLHTDKTLSTYTVKVLNECKRYGIKIMVATARPLRTTKQYCDLMDFDTMVVSNGARIICRNQRRDYGISQSSAERLLNALKHYPNLRITLETGDCAYSNHPIEDYDTILTDNLVDIADKEGALKILVHLDNEETLRAERKAAVHEGIADATDRITTGFSFALLVACFGVCIILAVVLYSYFAK